MKFDLTYTDIRAAAEGYEALSAMYQRMASRRLEAGDEATAATYEDDAANFSDRARRWRRTWELAVGVDLPMAALPADTEVNGLAA